MVFREDRPEAIRDRTRCGLATVLFDATAEPDSAAEFVAGGTVAGQPVAQASVRAIVAAAKAERAKRPKTAAATAHAKADAATVSIVGDGVYLALTREQAERAIARHR